MLDPEPAHVILPTKDVEPGALHHIESDLHASDRLIRNLVEQSVEGND